ncbi:M20 metallopeptidase family protein [Fuchsiella alkaliacetigena]|uniref:M20 metallopeptidase family protein n=1 Tax=Fuchsiella alkaliacetigena TaxID=957042 RepID=UPI002009FB9E|nr:amidohydrolase [Fuchsiella alkaliacetigena]MCK8824127.1 amidohydrolase [Fuchsiella alkaliacetigena]
MKKKIRKSIAQLQDKVISWRRAIHREPELGFAEEATAAKITKVLAETDLQVRTGVAKTGVVADLQIDEQLPTLALRADMDALPIQEQTGVEYASQNEGVMHACGHDGHVAILLGTAVILDRFRQELNTNLRFIFQPAEEGPGGALPMIKEGVLEGVDSILGLHLSTNHLTGVVELKAGAFSAAADQLNITVLGESGHGSAPQQTVDAILVAGEVITSLQTIVSRKISPHQAAVISLGKIEGGYRHNVIADSVRLKGTVRSTDPELRERLPNLIEEVVRGITRTHNADYELQYILGYPPLYNEASLVDFLEKNLTSLVEVVEVQRATEPSMGAEDFAYYCQRVPGAFYRLGAGKFPDSYPNHHPQFDFDEAALEIGIITFVESALNYN